MNSATGIRSIKGARARIAGTFLLSSLAIAGCRGATQPAVEKTSAKLTSTSSVVLELPAGLSSADLAVAATSGSVAVADRAKLVEPDGTPAAMTQAGASGTVNIGVEAQVGNITSAGRVELRNNAQVLGDLTTAADVSPSDGAYVTGTKQTGVAMTFTREEWTVEALADASRSYNLEPDRTDAIGPGRYGAASVKSRSTLTLSTGAYAFSSLGIEPQAELVVDDSRGPVRLYVEGEVTFRGTVRNTSGGHPALLVVQYGTSGGTVMLDSAFKGTVCAPNGRVVLATTTAAHEGSFLGREVEVRADARVVHRPYLRLSANLTWTVSGTEHGGFGQVAFDSNGTALAEGETAVAAISPSGTKNVVYSSGTPAKFVVGDGRFAVCTETEIELRDVNGSLVSRQEYNPLGYAKLVPGSTDIFLPDVKADLNRSKVLAAKFVHRDGSATSWAADVRISRITPSHVIYTTATELLCATHAGSVVWRTSTRLRTFEVSANGTTLIGVLDKAGSEIVHIDIPSGQVSTAVALDAPLWNLAAAPGGTYTAATTKTALYLFAGGHLSRRLDLSVAYASSVAVDDLGHAAVGGQLADRSGRIVLVGTPGVAGWVGNRPAVRDAYKPAVTFAPDGKRFVVAEEAGLAGYDITFTH